MLDVITNPHREKYEQYKERTKEDKLRYFKASLGKQQSSVHKYGTMQ